MGLLCNGIRFSLSKDFLGIFYIYRTMASEILDFRNIDDVTVLVDSEFLLLSRSFDRVLCFEDLVKFLELQGKSQSVWYN